MLMGVQLDLSSEEVEKIDALLAAGVPGLPAGSTIHDLATYLFGIVLTGLRREGSWERQVIEQMGLCP